MITFSKETLREALNGLRVLKLSKQVMPACQRVLIHAFDSVVWFDGTDLEQYLRYEGNGTCNAPARVLVPYEILANAGKQADAAGEIRVCPEGESCLVYPVSGSLISVPFPPLDVAEFYPKPTPSGELIHLPAGVIGAMREALNCASTDSSRYLLNSVYLDAHAVVATDGRQLYRRNSLDLPLSKGAIFPRSGVPGILPDTQAALSIWTENNRDFAQISVGRWRWITKLIDGTFPNYAQVIPRLDSYGAIVRLAEADVARLRAVVPKLPGFKDPHSIVVLSIAPGKGASLRTAPKQPKVQVALDRSEVTCAALVEVGLNAKYLLGSLDTGMRELHVRDAVSPLLLVGESRLQMWMPYGLGPNPAAAATNPPSAEAASAAAQSSDPSSHASTQVVSVEPAPTASDSAPEQTTPLSSTHTEIHNPSTTMVASATNSQPVHENREDTAAGAVASRVAPAPAHPVSVVDAINSHLARLRDLLREAGTEFANIQALVKEQQRSYRVLERDHEALKKNIRALREVTV
jgi:DNA polymerase III sliding clamp (beta) subunit (PCNA family)